MKETDTHIYFLKNWLSNFHKCDIKMKIASKHYPLFKNIEVVSNKYHVFKNTEQIFMYRKALTFSDYEIASKILKAEDPRDAKRLGRLVKNYDDETWDIFRYNIMYHANMSKYTQNEYLKKKLIDTYPKVLVECNPRDSIWGIGLSEDDPDIYDEQKWKGKNLLGKCLMEVRKDLIYGSNR